MRRLLPRQDIPTPWTQRSASLKRSSAQRPDSTRISILVRSMRGAVSSTRTVGAQMEVEFGLRYPHADRTTAHTGSAKRTVVQPYHRRPLRRPPEPILCASKTRFAPQPVPVSALEFLFDARTTVAGIVAKNRRRANRTMGFDPARMNRMPTNSSCRRTHLRPLVSTAFDAPAPGWPGARHHSADILIASEGPERVQSGRCLCACWERSTSNDTMVTRQVLPRSASSPRRSCSRPINAMLIKPRIFRVTSRDYRGHRKLWDPFLPADFQLAWDNSPPWRPNTRGVAYCRSHH